ncbi:MarR family winged helix-turn-helix transcriptional regulator [Atopomonas sediminilitoris]|uniref:MarR family winged helix-turn-helix transcriptional regulator n=1 Tax=Atopomonas sediminilitoris TaxID=2919919 RepID=UPI001F4E50AB|nr:MarR family transcriptional regulator [Atopomonas sediminilitoris]MCJ8168830.1 MarR family transcriptional regulator [Atopomonas sediminilitoris]
MLYACSRAVTKAYRPKLETLGLTYPQYLVMLVLWEWQRQPPEQASVKALGERLLLDSGTLTPLLKRLEQLGLVERRRAVHDERERVLALTEAGMQLKQQAASVPQTLLCESGVPAEEISRLRQELAQLLARVC